ncbi:4-hydroxyphenylpyruvate dioxygenase [Streptomyces sp. NPDC050504]|uniref:4-hydroxyphenylpyruvate dioxygenase n=1 Tax=Streptomyces sp. NPDC050504 TaxID=3365618 RepID=UPI003797A555
MTAHDVEFIEIYTCDQERTTDYFVSSFGFREMARCSTGGLDSTLLRQGGLQLVVSSGAAAAGFLAEHGDGVVDIAFACEDAKASWRGALAAEARDLTVDGAPFPAVSGFGAVRHTLVERPAGLAAGLPAGRPWALTPGSGAGRSGVPRLRRLDHVAVCLAAGRLHNAVRFYVDGLGFENHHSEYVTVGEQAMDSIVVRSRSGGITFTMVEPDPAKEPGQIDGFLDRNGGPGVQHLAFLVDEIVPAVLEFEAAGVEFLRTPGAYYDALPGRIGDLVEEVADLRRTNVLADRDVWGHLLQLCTRSPFERRTLFFELIQRHGAQGFGSSNIRALYEAVERAGVVAEAN